jgi:hypothetical protein
MLPKWKILALPTVHSTYDSSSDKTIGVSVTDNNLKDLLKPDTIMQKVPKVNNAEYNNFVNCV